MPVEQDTQNEQVFPEILSPDDVSTMLDRKAREIGEDHLKILSFLAAPHKAEDSQEWQKKIQKTEKELARLRLAALEVCQASGSGVRLPFWDECTKLMDETVKLQERLGKDVAELKAAEEKRTFDPLKVFTHILVFPAATFGVLKAIGQDNLINLRTAATVIGLGLGLHFARDVRKLWKRAIKDITPKDIKNCLVVYFWKEELAQGKRKFGSLFFKRPGDKQAKPAQNDNREPQ